MEAQSLNLLLLKAKESEREEDGSQDCKSLLLGAGETLQTVMLP